MTSSIFSVFQSLMNMTKLNDWSKSKGIMWLTVLLYPVQCVWSKLDYQPGKAGDYFMGPHTPGGPEGPTVLVGLLYLINCKLV